MRTLAPASASPDGGTWVSIASAPAYTLPTGSGPAQNEAMSQKVSGFTIGNSYTLTWYHANFGWTNDQIADFASTYGIPEWSYVFDAANSIQVFADGVLVGGGSTLALGAGWVEESISFIALDTELDLTFTSVEKMTGDRVSYQSIDGIRLTDTPVPPNAVPEPAALSLFSGAGLAMLLAGRRRKQAKQAS